MTNDEQGDNNELAADLAAAYLTLARAVELCAATIERPLEALAEYHWKRAVARYPAGARLLKVENDQLESNSSNDTLYWVEPGIKALVEDPMPLAEDCELWDEWLARNCVPMSRIVTEPIVLSLETEPWAASSSAALGAVYAELDDRFGKLLSALRAAGTETQILAVLRPKIVMVAGETPFNAELHIRCYCGNATHCQIGDETADDNG